MTTACSSAPLALAAAVAVATTAQASTNCHQTYTLLGVTRFATPTAWIALDRNGECHSSKLVQVPLSGAEPITTMTDLFEDWDWAHEAVRHLELLETYPLSRQNHAWTSGEGLVVEAPAPNDSLAAQFLEHVRDGGSNGWTWLAERGEAGVIAALVNGSPAEVVYAYPGGLYVDYTIASVVGIARREELIVFTKQEQRAAGLDTMDGFLIVRPAPAVATYHDHLIVTLTREDIDFVIEVGFEVRDGLWRTVGAVYGGDDAFWLMHGVGLHEYDLTGRHLKSVELTSNRLPVEDVLVFPDRLHVLRMRAGRNIRATIETFLVHDREWQAPTILPLAEGFASDTPRRRLLAAVGDEVWVTQPRSPVSMPIIAHGTVRPDLKRSDAHSTGVFWADSRWFPPVARNHKGSWLRIRKPHFGRGVGEDFNEMEVIAADGRVVAEFRDVLRGSGGIEMQPQPPWALLDDDTALFVRAIVSGTLSDRIEVIHWKPDAGPD